MSFRRHRSSLPPHRPSPYVFHVDLTPYFKNDLKNDLCVIIRICYRLAIVVVYPRNKRVKNGDFGDDVSCDLYFYDWIFSSICSHHFHHVHVITTGTWYQVLLQYLVRQSQF